MHRTLLLVIFVRSIYKELKANHGHSTVSMVLMARWYIVFYWNRGNNKAKLPQCSLSPRSDLLITLRGGCVLQNPSSGGGRSCAAVHQRVQPLLRNHQDTVAVQLRYRHHQVIHWLLLNTTSHHYYLLVILSTQDLSEPPSGQGHQIVSLELHLTNTEQSSLSSYFSILTPNSNTCRDFTKSPWWLYC